MILIADIYPMLQHLYNISISLVYLQLLINLVNLKLNSIFILLFTFK